jgi:galacturan 1,4-alpha-galacturonidase
VLTAQNPAANGYYENGGLPRGGGWGSVKNIVLSNFNVGNANAGPLIYQDNGNNGTLGTSLIHVSNVVFENFTGSIGSTKGGTLQCSKVYPCYNIEFKNVDLLGGNNLTGTCKNIVAGSVHGLTGSGC